MAATALVQGQQRRRQQRWQLLRRCPVPATVHVQSASMVARPAAAGLLRCRRGGGYGDSRHLPVPECDALAWVYCHICACVAHAYVRSRCGASLSDVSTVKYYTFLCHRISTSVTELYETVAASTSGARTLGRPSAHGFIPGRNSRRGPEVGPELATSRPRSPPAPSDRRSECRAAAPFGVLLR